MNDKSDGGDKRGRDGKGRGRGPRPGGGDRPRARQGGGERQERRGGGDGRPERGGKPFGQRGEGKPRMQRDGQGKPFGRREERAEASPGGGEERGPRKAFVPKSRGMFSHGGREADGSQKRPRSFGRLSHEGGEGERKPRSFSDRPRGDRPREGREGREERPRRTVESESAVGTMRIAKRLARAGIASRRDAEGMIADGRVKLNGKLLDTPAVDVGASDRIEIDGAPIPAIERTRLWLFHKPAGLVTTNRDPEGRPTVFDRLPDDMPRVLSVGRLDINTEGLLLLTNDGGLARVLELPATGWLRRYRVRAHGSIEQARLDELRQGIAIDGVFYGAVEASLDREQGSNVWLTLGLREGKNREVKKILGHLGLEVNRLIRVSFGPFQLGELAEGAVQEIRGRTLRDQLGERLIEEAGADFDAPIVRPFSNKPVAEKRDGERRSQKPRGEWISASEAKPNRKKFGERKREDALERLDTRKPRSFDEAGKRERPRFERAERGERRDDAGGEEPRKAARRPASAGKRTANVWMAPGARAVGEKRQAEREERDRLKATGGVSRGPRPAAGGPRKPRKPGPPSPRGEGPGKRPPR